MLTTWESLYVALLRISSKGCSRVQGNAVSKALSAVPGTEKGQKFSFHPDLRLSPATEPTRGWLQARGSLSLLISGRRVSRGAALRLSLPVEGPEGQVQSLLAGVDVVS